MLVAIYKMTWRILRSEGPSYFLASDNPAYLFEAHGLGKPESELILPLCRDLLLHCSWQECKKDGIQFGHQKLIKEFNRRTACGAARFVFYHEQAPWVLSAAKNDVQQLTRILW
jgi:hypothetical protein